MNEKMTIVMLENAPSSQEGGQELSFFDLAKGFAEKGHDVVLLYVKEGDLLEQYRGFCKKTIKVAGYRFSSKHPIRSLTALFRDLSKVPSYPRMVVYANQYLDSLFACFLAKLKNCPFICHLRLPPPDEFSRQYKYGIKRASNLIAVSEHTRQDYIRRGFDGDLIHVVHNGIDPERFAPFNDPREGRLSFGIPQDAFVVTYAGRLHPAKGLETLLEAFSVALSGGTERLVISGYPAELGEFLGKTRDYKSELESYAVKLGIEDRVIWIRHCNDMPHLFNASDIIVLPSLWPEPFGRTLIESMACGIPAIGSEAGGIPEILSGEFAAHLFRPGITDDLAVLLGKLRNWRRLDPALAGRCRSHIVNNFNVQTTVNKIESIFVDTLDQFREGVRRPMVAKQIQ